MAPDEPEVLEELVMLMLLSAVATAALECQAWMFRRSAQSQYLSSTLRLLEGV